MLLCDLYISIYFIIPYIGRVAYRVERNLSTSEAKLGELFLSRAFAFSRLRCFIICLYWCVLLICTFVVFCNKLVTDF